MNVFRKYLKKEIGSNKYIEYMKIGKVDHSSRDIQSEKIEDNQVYLSMYQNLRMMDAHILEEKLERLLTTMYLAFQIGRHYLFVSLFYFSANFTLIALQLDTRVTWVSMVVMGVSFLYKTYEFLVNRYCFMDAYLVILYKTALEKLLKPSKQA